MRAKQEFINKDKAFWACVRSLSQHIGYSKQNAIIVPTFEQMGRAFDDLELDSSKLLVNQQPTALGIALRAYFEMRAKVISEYVAPRLMTGEEARLLYTKKKRELKPKCNIPMNKQKGDKRAEAYLTGLVNMHVEASIGNLSCVYDPRELTTVTRDGLPVRTLARRVDGAFPSTVNPIAIWEVKEYYYTTTFGSRIADGVYETLLDGLELEELRTSEDIHVKHYLMVDAHYTWWMCGKPYLCRIIDMLHMGYVDEVLFGKEVVERLPGIAAGWAAEARKLGKLKDRNAELPA